MFGDNLVFIGGQVKALGQGKFAAPGVRFSSPTEPDLTEDFFTKTTDFWQDFPARLPLLYSHGLDDTIKRKRLGPEGSVKVEMTDAALWIEGQLDLRDEYEAAIYEMIEAGKMGTSSGSASHLVERKQVGKAWQILSWPLVELSLTPTPAEPRNSVMPVKTLFGILPNNGRQHTPPSFEEAEIDIKTVRDFEKFLREEGGFSRREAAAIASHGFKAIDPQRDSAGNETPGTSLLTETMRLKTEFARLTRLRTTTGISQ